MEPLTHTQVVPIHLLEHLASCDGLGPTPTPVVPDPQEPADAFGQPVTARQFTPARQFTQTERSRIAEAARRTLLLDQALRHGPVEPGEPRLPGAESSGASARTVSDAAHSEFLPGAAVRTEDGRSAEEEAPADPSGREACPESAERAFEALGAARDCLADIARIVDGLEALKTFSAGAPATEPWAIVDPSTVAEPWTGEPFPEGQLRWIGKPAVERAVGALPLQATVRFGNGYQNAFRAGTAVVLGEGDGLVFGSLAASLGVVGHGLAHGLLRHAGPAETGRPQGGNQPDGGTGQDGGTGHDGGQAGALRVSFADVVGVLVEQHAAGHTAEQASWLLGEGLFTDRVNARALRSLAAPGTAYDDPLLGRDPQPDHMDGYLDAAAEHAAHLNAGIPNRAFHLAATALGGYAWERAGAIWLAAALSRPLPADAGFALFARRTVREAGRLFGSGSAEQSAIRAAWAAVGVSTAARTDAGPAHAGAAL
ncbi:hypothetical protein GCM10023081_37540 [Arthrobacter ginkgonis]|uniref:Metalloprotease n=1 Tax=Arthrobacter ginkgonis TaxID=1630594 RepID=A0ABP7CZK3_9MICC